MKPQKVMTLCFLLKELPDGRRLVCLAEKKRGFRAGKINGVGGKQEGGETLEECARRETLEEVGVILEHCQYIGIINFEDWNLEHVVHVYISKKWQGDPVETEEMRPFWIDINEVPYHKMGSADRLWIPYIFMDKRLRATFKYSKDNYLTDVQIVFAEGVDDH